MGLNHITHVLTVVLSLLVAQATWAQDGGWMEVTSFEHPEDPDTFVVQYLWHYGGTHALSVQVQYTPFGVVVIEDESSEGSTTNPTGQPDIPLQNGASNKEYNISIVIAQLGYVIINQPTIPSNDPFRQRYPNSNPDYKIEGSYFDLYSPANSTSPINVASNVDDKISNQVDRVIIEFPRDATPERIQAVIDAIQDTRDTPNTATRSRLEELWIIKPNRTLEKVFPGSLLR